MSDDIFRTNINDKEESICLKEVLVGIIENVNRSFQVVTVLEEVTKEISILLVLVGMNVVDDW